jgi:hypothetical protein
MEFRFEEFGGIETLKEMTDIVGGLRDELESFFSDRILSDVCNTPECFP